MKEFSFRTLKIVVPLIVVLALAIVSFSVFNANASNNQSQKAKSISVPRQQAAVPAYASQGTTTPAAGAALPNDATCGANVQLSSWEPRQDNYNANHQIPTAQQIANLAVWNTNAGFNPKADSLRKLVTGNYTGTTDEILQWVACKWGIDVNIVRAQAIQESNWHQSQRGDWTNNKSICPPGTWTGKGCYQSYGILQIKYMYNKSAWPISRNDTAFSADYTYAQIRACYEGWVNYLYSAKPSGGYPRYHAGDIWGCVGRWFSGGWYDQGAINYIKLIKSHMNNKEWLASNF